MAMWPISTRVNKPENDDPSILDQELRRVLREHFVVRPAMTPGEYRRLLS
jgi:hypothetical protein